MMPRVRLKVLRGSFEMSTPSKRMRPEARGLIRNKATNMELFPEPERPHTPTWLMLMIMATMVSMTMVTIMVRDGRKRV